MVEEELEMVRTWLYNRDLLDDPNGKELPPVQALCRFQALSKCQFRDTIVRTTQCTFLHCQLPFEDKFVAVQINIGWVWDPKYHYHLAPGLICLYDELFLLILLLLLLLLLFWELLFE